MRSQIRMGDERISNNSPINQEIKRLMSAVSHGYLRGPGLLRSYLQYLSVGLINCYAMGGYQLDFSPDSLRMIDDHNLNENLRDDKWSKYNHVAAYCSEGFYFGEVLVRHLNGKWVWPSDWRIGLFRFLFTLGFPFKFVGNIAFKHCKVDINGNLIPVMKIADWRLRRKKGLRYWRPVYDLIQQTGGTKYYFSDRCPECGKRKKGYKYCRRCGAQLY